MSEFHVTVEVLESIERHPNADTLEISVVKGYPVIFKENQYKVGDKIVYIPVDSLVPITDPRFAFLDDGVVGRMYARVKGKKLRNIYSIGLVIPADSSWEVGQNVQAELGVEKWEPKLNAGQEGETEQDPGYCPVFTDIESLRKHKDILKEGENVVITEKIHGCLKFDTKVLMASGLEKEIQYIQPGDEIYSYDESRKFCIKKVKQKIVRPAVKEQKWISILLENGKTLTLTKDHKVLTEDGWVEASKLTISSNIVSY